MISTVILLLAATTALADTGCFNDEYTQDLNCNTITKIS